MNLRNLAVALVAAGFSVACASSEAPPAPETELQQAASAIATTMRAHHYDPQALATADYAAVERRVGELAAQAQSTQEFVDGFNEIWRDGPFSQVSLRQADASAEATAQYLDTMRVGGSGANLAWDGDIAILTVTTMMGADTIEQIDAAYADRPTADPRLNSLTCAAMAAAPSRCGRW